MIALRFGLRRLLAAPAFTTAGIVTLALGVGANSLAMTGIGIGAAIALALMAAAGAACALPAWQAASVDPSVTLRAE